MTAKHRSARNHQVTYKWMGTGAITLGIGAAAVVGGAGVAEAKTGNPDGSAGSAHSAAAPQNLLPLFPITPPAFHSKPRQQENHI